MAARNSNPVNKTAEYKPVVFELEGAPDERGMSRFTAVWTDEYGRQRAQVFLGNLNAHIKLWFERGYNVELIQKGA